jgi:hypothetical protein
VDHKSRLLLRLPLDARFRIIFVQQPRANFDQHPICQAIYVSRESKLPRQHHGSVRTVIEQNRRPVSAVVRFPVLCLPSPISPQEIKRGLLQHIPIVRQCLHRPNPHPPRFRHRAPPLPVPRLISTRSGISQTPAERSPCAWTGFQAGSQHGCAPACPGFRRAEILSTHEGCIRSHRSPLTQSPRSSIIELCRFSHRSNGENGRLSTHGTPRKSRAPPRQPRRVPL